MFKRKIDNVQQKDQTTTHYSETPIKSNQNNLSEEVVEDNKIEVTYYILFVEDHRTMEMMIIMIVSNLLLFCY